MFRHRPSAACERARLSFFTAMAAASIANRYTNDCLLCNLHNRRAIERSQRKLGTNTEDWVPFSRPLVTSSSRDRKEPGPAMSGYSPDTPLLCHAALYQQRLEGWQVTYGLAHWEGNYLTQKTIVSNVKPGCVKRACGASRRSPQKSAVHTADTELPRTAHTT